MDMEGQYQTAVEAQLSRFKGLKNTSELIACVEELLQNQPFERKVIGITGTSGEFSASIELYIRGKTCGDVLQSLYEK